MPFHPAPGRRVTSNFGPRISPISGRQIHHNGTDWGGVI